MQWILKKYKDLTLNELHDIIQLRINVFVVEQNCPYPELDNKDKIAYHLFCINKEEQIIAYTRIFNQGDYYNEASFGRVVVHQDFRKQKLGHELIKQTIDNMQKLFGDSIIKIGAQTYLKEFYKSFGFAKYGKEYLEDGIPHIYMLKRN